MNCDPLARQPMSYRVEVFLHLSKLDLADVGGESDNDTTCMW